SKNAIEQFRRQVGRFVTADGRHLKDELTLRLLRGKPEKLLDQVGLRVHFARFELDFFVFLTSDKPLTLALRHLFNLDRRMLAFQGFVFDSAPLLASRPRLPPARRWAGASRSSPPPPSSRRERRPG